MLIYRTFVRTGERNRVPPVLSLWSRPGAINSRAAFIVDRITGFLYPVVLGIAILTFVLWVTIGGIGYISCWTFYQLFPFLSLLVHVLWGLPRLLR